MNKNTGRFIAHLYFDEWDGYEPGKGHGYELKVTEEETRCEVYVFAPEFANEGWEILILKYYGYTGCSQSLRNQIDALAKLLNATVLEEDAE